MTKLNAAGSAFTYSTYLGGSADELLASIAVDSGGNAYLAGGTISSNFPVTPGAFDTVKNGFGVSFLTKLNPTGSALAYSTYVDDGGGAVAYAVDVVGTNAYVAGFAGTGYPTTPGANNTTSGGAFVTKFNTSGSAQDYSTFLGNASSFALSLAVDADGGAWTTGITGAAAFPTTPGAHDTTQNGTSDLFVTQLDPAGSALEYSTFLGGNGSEGALPPTTNEAGVAVDTHGNAYATGHTDSANFPTTGGAHDATLGGAQDAFVSKIDPDLPGSGETADDEDVALGETVSTGGTPTADDPVETSVTSLSPTSGEVTITEGSITEDPPSGFQFLGQQVDITAPGGATIAFRIDGSLLPPGVDAQSLQVFRDGVLVEDCTAPLVPDPCVSDRSDLAGGDVELEVTTSEASAWNFGLSTNPQCSDEIDNDDDGQTDHPNDPGCASPADDSEAPDPVLPACSDGADNEGDGRTDFPADPGCSSALDDDEAAFLFGKGTVGGSFSSMSTNVKRASKHFLYYGPVRVTRLRAYIDGNGGGAGSQVLRGVIYSGTNPTALAAQTGQATITAGDEGRWVDLPLSSPLTLGPGYYWLGLHSGPAHGVARYAWDASSPGSRRYNIDSYAGGASDPFGTASTFSDNQRVSIHAMGDRGPGPTN